MRYIKSLEDAQKVINELLDWKERLSTKDWDLHKLRIKNVSPGVDPDDCVVVKQLPKTDITFPEDDLYYSLIFTKEGEVLSDEIIPDAIIGNHREGHPNEVYLSARIAPSSGNLVININVNDVNILATDLILPQGNTSVVKSSEFISPLPMIGYQSKVHPIIVQGGGAAAITIVLTLRRI